MEITKTNTVGQVSVTIKVNVKLTLWAAIKLRIAGIKNILKDKALE
jgi:hypothetical protein